MKLEQQQKMYDALNRISKQFDKSERVLKNAERDYGLSPIEALEMAYDNMQETARFALKGLKRPSDVK